jgi:purine catabolism regulator
VLRRAIAAHERLERVVLSERGLEALAATLSTLIGAAVLVHDARGEPLVQRAFRREVDSDTVIVMRDEICDRARRREARTFVPSAGDIAERALALPVTADGGAASAHQRVPEAWLVAIKDTGPLTDFDRLTLHQAVTIVALELLRGRVAGDTERRLAGDVLAAIVEGQLAGPDLARRLEPFGLAERVAVIVVQRSVGGRGGPGPIEDALAAALRDEAAPGLVASAGPYTCALIAGMAEEQQFALAQARAARVDRAAGPGLRFGVGRPVAGAETRRSFHEARCAVEALAFGVAGEPTAGANGNGDGNGNRSVTRPVSVANYKDLGSFQLLLSLQDDEALKLFCDSILGPIEASEGHYGGELMRSLEAFIEENGQWERAARRLYCHRHTLRYRIKRVEELTGRDLHSARDRIEFWLALRGRELAS